MDQTPAPTPSPRPIETWSTLVLRHPSGLFLATGSRWIAMTSQFPYCVEHWGNSAEFAAWLADRPESLRRQLDADGWLLVEHRVTIRPGAATPPAPRPEPRPIVAEAVQDHV